MKVGVFVQTAEGESLRMFRVEEVVSTIERAEQLGFESAWVMDHPFIDTPGGRITGHDPMILLGAAAVRTTRIRLGTLVVCPAFRGAGQLARESAAVADAAGGRFILGLGSGWHQPEFDAFDYPFDHRVGRFEEQVEAVSRLLARERVTMEGRYVRLRDAEVLATAPPPPIWIACKGPRMMRLTARLADGWNMAWGGGDADWLAEPLATLRQELEAAGRDRASFTVSAGMSWTPEMGVDLGAALRSYETAGVDLLILSLAEGPGRRTSPEYLERAAEVVTAARPA
jgi:alkanesulfonate monooxygenase SsuD/methylene tetrahydromethanopterin reductase-like flavin-dependent oxidoreductase (luciferase family)